MNYIEKIKLLVLKKCRLKALDGGQSEYGGYFTDKQAIRLGRYVTEEIKSLKEKKAIDPPKRSTKDLKSECCNDEPLEEYWSLEKCNTFGPDAKEWFHGICSECGNKATFNEIRILEEEENVS